MRLYEIDSEAGNLLLEAQDFDDDTPQNDIDTWLAKFEENRSERIEKYESIFKFMKNTEAMLIGTKEEEKRIGKLKKRYEKRVLFLKGMLKTSMELHNNKKIETSLFKATISNSTPSLEIFDEVSIPKQFIKSKVTVSFDKIKIKEYIKAEGEVEGARLIPSTKITIS